MGTRKTALVALLMLLAACAADEGVDPSRDGPTVMATTTILGDVAANVAQGAANVAVLMGPGTDPHDFQPSAEQVGRLRSAELVVANGLGLEAGLGDMLESARAEGANLIELAPQLDPIPFDAHTHQHEDGDTEGDGGDDHEHGALDPHFWLDPTRMAEAARLTAAALAEAIPARADAISQAGEDYAAQLLELDAEIGDMLAVIPPERRKLATNHEALGYLADRYEFEIIGSVIPGGDTLAEPSAGSLAALVATLKSEGVSDIFAEASSPIGAAEAVAAELGPDAAVHVLYIESLGDSDSDVSSYIEMMRVNAATIVAALG